jgi:hypothetical protein
MRVSDWIQIQDEVRKVRVPLSCSDELYNLRLHIRMLRNRLQDLRSDQPASRTVGMQGADTFIR